MPLQINFYDYDGTGVWPDDVKSDAQSAYEKDHMEGEIKISDETKSTVNVKQRKVYFHFTDLEGNELIFPEETDLIQFEAWLEQGTGGVILEGEVINKYNLDCGHTEANGYTLSYLNLNCFTQVSSGNILHIQPTNNNPNSKLYT